jgi:tetratricopeptide (TPR) repeat protein
MIVGLWWLLRNLETRPVRGWAGLLIAYTVALFCRETAAVLPGLAAVLVLVYAEGDGRARLRKTMPVLVLLVPLALYLVVRDQALGGPALAAGGPEGDWTSAFRQVDSSRLLQGEILLRTAGVWSDALRIAVWPVGLQVSYATPGWTASWIALAAQAILCGVAVFHYRRGRKGLLVGLLIFYLALLPSSRLIGGDANLPHLNARYLYEPMIGLALLAAYGLTYLRTRFDRTLAAVPVVLAVMLMTPVTWARNEQWTDEKELFESDFRKGVRTTNLLRLVTALYLRESNFSRVAEICDAHPEIIATSGDLSSHCATAYSYLGRSEDAVAAYRISAENSRLRRLAYWNLGKHYLRQQDWEMARSNLERAVEAEQDPARKAYYAAYSIMLLYPATPEKWLKARTQLERAVRLQPGYDEAQLLLEQINQALGTSPRGDP